MYRKLQAKIATLSHDAEVLSKYATSKDIVTTLDEVKANLDTAASKLNKFVEKEEKKDV